MKIGNIINPNRKTEPADILIEENRQVHTLTLEEIATACKYIRVVDAAGTPIGAIQAERLRYLIECTHSVSQFQILDRLRVGVIAIDTDSRIFYVNNAYETILGVPRGKTIARYLNVIEKNAQLLQVLKNEQEMTVERQLVESVGRYVTTQMFPLYENGVLSGACSVFTDVTQIDHLESEVRRIREIAQEYKIQIKEQEYLRRHSIIGESEAFLRCVEKASLVADTDINILIRGENGTGKEVIADLIREGSERSNKPFVKINCAAIPESLFESELFGYEEGAFTDAKKGGKIGRFQMADGGTIFLDEIGELPLAMQSKLLRVLQQGEVERVGGKGADPVDVRVIAATNEPLEQMIKDGRFRMDLYYRLNVVSIEVPPLRERENDILLLAAAFLGEANKKYDRRKRLDPDVYHHLLQYRWPGNVRELRNVIESLCVLSASSTITEKDLPERLRTISPETDNPAPRRKTSDRMMEEAVAMNLPLRDSLRLYEKELLAFVMERNHKDHKKTMEQLGLARRTFYRKLAEYGLNHIEP